MSRHCLISLLILCLARSALGGQPPAAAAAATATGTGKKSGEAGKKSAKPQPPDWIMVFANGDRLHCQLRGLVDGKLAFSSRMAPGRTLHIEISKVQSLNRGEANSAGSVPWADTLHLHNGSQFRGRFASLTEKSLKFRIIDGDVASFPRTALKLLSTPAGAPAVRLKDGTTYQGKLLKRGEKMLEFEAHKVGVVKIPLEKVAQLAPPVMPRVPPGTHAKRHLVVTGAGDVLIGELKQGADGALVISGGAVEASCRPSAIRCIRFPLETGRPGGSVKPKGKAVGVLLSSGSTAVGVNPVIKDGRFSFTLLRGGEMSLPLSAVSRLTMTGELPNATSSGNILVWGRYADRGEEFARTVAALKKHLKGARIVENFSAQFDAGFKAQLAQARALVIPELEKWNVSMSATLAAQLKPLAVAFLRRGGNIVICGADTSPCAFLRAAGLIDVTKVGSISGSAQTFATTGPGRLIAKGIGTTVTAANATYTYRIGSSISGSCYLTTSTSSCAIVGRKVGSGWVVLMGPDFYETNTGMEKVLANAVNMK
jgi:hypothetical protein